jgi:hypothetical protein
MGLTLNNQGKEQGIAPQLTSTFRVDLTIAAMCNAFCNKIAWIDNMKRANKLKTK